MHMWTIRIQKRYQVIVSNRLFILPCLSNIVLSRYKESMDHLGATVLSERLHELRIHSICICYKLINWRSYLGSYVNTLDVNVAIKTHPFISPGRWLWMCCTHNQTRRRFHLDNPRFTMLFGEDIQIYIICSNTKVCDKKMNNNTSLLSPHSPP